MPDFSLEHAARKQFPSFHIVGIDEAGRGPLAGPVYAAAVVFPEGYEADWVSTIQDSKKLTELKRNSIYNAVTCDNEIAWHISEASVLEIETHNILGATHIAMKRAVNGLGLSSVYCLIDGNPVKNFPYNAQNVVKGDTICNSISVAGILAKVSRDELMKSYHEEYPEYHFNSHKGYGTKLHLEALDKLGPSPHHRKTFAPIRRILEKQEKI